MYVVLAWFSDRNLPETVVRAARERFESAVSTLVPDTYQRHDLGGPDWGVTFLHRGDQGAYRWPMHAVDGRVTALSLGLPVGAEVTGGPVAMARRLLDGADIHRAVVPPFGLIAVDGDERFAIQQDWVGMCRLFTGSANGITAFCSRPSLLATFLTGAVEPDLAGWASYAVVGHFGGDLSPVRGTTLLEAGRRVTGRRRPGGGWELTEEIRYNVDDVVMSGFAGQGRSVEDSLDLAAQAITGTAASVSELYGEAITLGLSGGKDSRLIAASLVAAGLRPKFATNEDTAAEGVTARELVRILRDKRGLDLEHQLSRSGAPDDVLKVGLYERAARLQRLHDFQFPSTYTIRPAVREQLRDQATPVSFTGAAGELSTGYWYPAAEGRTPEEEALTRLTAAVPKGAVIDGAVGAERARITGLLDHAKGIGLRDLHLIDYVYLVERVRRWYTSAYAIGMVTPFLSPGFVAATFGLTAAQKRERLLHNGLIERLVPEWADIPFVSISTGKSTAARVWDGDGVHVIADLLDTARGPIAQLMHRDVVEKALVSAVHNDKADQRVLRQFTALGVASARLEPGTAGPVTGAAFGRVTAPPKPVVPKQTRRLPWLRKVARKILR
ncbi:hypothetical protein [Actinoplanes sp. L3-i22]|uniref:hypothetical protein n=1 Tax=Actinoplanes sp. L3-i22 TaxID=2836373 RepID=UPI001C786145|nr:hypothetical protein [Actinoplanes sp. L3-i22]BCY05508.1 hypothetical protein L3i22_005960 [Actinoplanes sp. L3-i22]